jgi:hypothetical protein
MTDAATEARARAILAEAYGCADDFHSVNTEVMLQGIGPILALPALTADRDRIRGEAIEEAAARARTVDLFDGERLKNSDPRITVSDAIRALAQPGPVDDGWRDIATAPKDQQLIGWWPLFGGTDGYLEWNDDKYAKRPRPYWSAGRDERVWGALAVRANQPTHWRHRFTPPASTGGEVAK